MDSNSLAHSRYNCTYHIIFIPKYVTVQPTRLTMASNIGYILAGAVPVGSAIRLH